MINNLNIIAIIPARSGSKRLINKNILKLNNKPLIAWTIEAAKQSKYIDKVIVSTDSENISSISKEFGAEVPSLRPAELAQDHSTTLDVLKHVVNSDEYKSYDIVVVLQPTSPLRNVDDIDASIKLMIESDGKGVVSVCECEHSPFWSNTLPEDGNLGGFIDPKYKVRSQELPKCYRLNGAVYVYSKEVINEEGMVMDSQVFSYIMPINRSVDIDTKQDFRIAEVLMVDEHE